MRTPTLYASRFRPRALPLPLAVRSASLVRVCGLLLAVCGFLFGAVPTIPSDSIRPGMKGYGLSVFTGYKVDKFDVEVIDVMRNVFATGDLILARLSGQGLEQFGVIAGMSGSPVYLEGRLAGAVSYGWRFSKEPIAGITPINMMLDVWNAPSGKPGSGMEKRASASPAGLTPLLVPLALSGYTPALAELVRPTLSEFGFLPVAAAGTAPDADLAQADTMLVPGAAVGVALVDGDVRLSGIGTLTWREGQRILAFGHPMLQAGSVELPMIAGRIHTVMPSYESSFKLFSPSRPVGTITEDRLAAIGGTIGPVPTTIPVSVKLASPAVNRDYNYSVARHPALAGELAAIGLAEVLLCSEGMYEEMTLFSEMKLRVEDTTTVTVRHCFAGPGPAVDLYRRSAQELSAVFGNRFREVSVTDITFNLRFTAGRSRMRLVSCRPDRSVARPGEIVTLSLTTKDDAGTSSTEVRQVRIPASAPAGRLTVVVTSRDSLNQREEFGAPGKSNPKSLTGLWRLLESSGRENELVIAGYISATGLTVVDRELPAPPPTLRRLIEATSEGELVQRTGQSKLFEESFLLDRVVLGTCELTLEVRR